MVTLAHCCKSPTQITEELLGHIDWIDSSAGYCQCPGADLHTGRAGFKDCKVYLDKVPTIYCCHESCSEKLAIFNHTLRSSIARQTGPEGALPDKKAMEERRLKLQREDEIKRRARSGRPEILKNWKWDLASIHADSPSPIPAKPNQHWRLLLNQFNDDDVIWIGDLYQSGDEKHAANFRSKAEWLEGSTCPGKFTCPSTFAPGTFSRSISSVRDLPFLVVESDTLSKDEMGAIFRWLHKSVDLDLRAIVDTGGKSLHGWFARPCEETFAELKLILPELGCDEKLFNRSQPVRLPGAFRGPRFQRLVYLKEKEVSNVCH